MTLSSSASHHDRPANRLAQETSPYLLQHAYNPVDWFPWGPEAFEKAKQEDKPIFLSIGYSACHWCHVMERESFENESIAKFLNENFVSIKVDREERPDLDQIYMSAVQLITRRGGWPMSVFLTPDAAPFYGGTYWPPTSRLGMPGFPDILHKLNDYWRTKRDEVITSSAELVNAVSDMSAPVFEDVPLGEETLRHAMRELIESADRRHGGFGGAPKFPHPMDIRVLLRGWKRFGEEAALDVALFTLRKMANGGIYDHLGGGFHRYSTDAMWLVPHFEKMLYDNALLVPAYLEAYQITQDPQFETVIRETLDYVLREMTSPEGGFYATQDADSEGEEGKFFVWSEQEIRQALGDREAELFNDCYDVTPRGNWEGKTILNRPRAWGEIATLHGISIDELHRRLAICRQTLFELRGHRIAPGRDDKILTGWNGMMITAMAQAGLILNEPRYRDAAVQACDFLLENLFDSQGQLL
ncbi:MAG TPA: thioredoxin domain-containing protein, partial [Planctomicrobium sp.]|nr:thioredoxin domain-containing protein [Planctomicrobium sp.]